MKPLFTSKFSSIPSQQVVSGIVDGPYVLCVIRGRIWLTVEGVREDFWLSGGDVFEVPPGRLVVIEAGNEPSRIQLRRRPTVMHPGLPRRDGGFMQARDGKADGLPGCRLSLVSF